MDPYDEGYEDGMNGNPDNPYPYGTTDYEDYEDGYWDGIYASDEFDV